MVRTAVGLGTTAVLTNPPKLHSRRLRGSLEVVIQRHPWIVGKGFSFNKVPKAERLLHPVGSDSRLAILKMVEEHTR